MSFRNDLEAMGACDEALEWVGERSLAEAWAECQCGDWMRWLCEYLDLWTFKRDDEYERVVTPAWAEYERVRAPALAEYERVAAQAWAEYERVRASALAEHERVEAQAWAEYERVAAQAWAEYERVRAPALAEYERITAQVIRDLVPFAEVKAAWEARKRSS